MRAGTLTYAELPELFQAPPQLRQVTEQILNTNITNILLNDHMVTENYKQNLPLCPPLNMGTLQMQACFPTEIHEKHFADYEYILFTDFLAVIGHKGIFSNLS
jgi:hypothetical protein